MRKCIMCKTTDCVAVCPVNSSTRPKTRPPSTPTSASTAGCASPSALHHSAPARQVDEGERARMPCYANAAIPLNAGR